MRLRLFLSFFLIVIGTTSVVVIIARQTAAQEVRAFMLRGGMAGLDELALELEEYYLAQGSWSGVDSLLSMPGHMQRRGQGMGPGNMAGMMNQRLRLADVEGELIIDTAGESLPGSRLSEAELGKALPLMNGRQTIGYLLAEGGASFSNTDEQILIRRLNRAALTGGLIAAGLALFMALFLSGQLTHPIRLITLAAGRLGQGDLAQRVPVQGNDELAQLAESFNRMAASLQQANESRRAMTADIAHELRNPLAIQRASLEALLDGIYPLTLENLAPILDQNVLLTRLVDDLRTLALAEGGQLTLERIPVDFQNLVEQAARRFQPQAEARQILLTVETTHQPEIPFPELKLDPQRIEQVLNNLLSNAIRHTPDGGKITFNISHTKENVILQLRDSGPGIPKEALPYIFDRFFRADRSRTRSEGGTGLGLAIARQLVIAHGGTLSARNHPSGGAEFTLTLPV